MQIEFSGAAREVTGSCHIVRAGGKTVLLDCGLFQGHRRDADTKNRKLPCPIEAIDAVVLSHAHLDHSGRLPFLAANGYSKLIHATKATADLTSIMLADSARIQENDFDFLTRRGKTVAPPLYGPRDAAQVQELMRIHAYGEWFDVCAGMRARYTDAGHILGSASIVLEATEGATVSRLVFSGDVGRSGLPIIRDPEPPTDPADVVIMESTYGDRDHESVAAAREHLARVVRETSARGGRVLIPAFAVGRAQGSFTTCTFSSASARSPRYRSSSTARWRQPPRTCSRATPIYSIRPRRRSGRSRSSFDSNSCRIRTAWRNPRG